MPSKRELNGITNDIISSLNSRNNDYLGYWATGQLYRLALENNTTYVKLDIINKSIIPSDPYFNALFNIYTEMLEKHLNPRNIPFELLKEVTIEYNFEQEIDKKLHPYIGPGKPYTIKIIIITDTGQTYSGLAGGYCRPHDPKKEQRRNGF